MAFGLLIGLILIMVGSAALGIGTRRLWSSRRVAAIYLSLAGLILVITGLAIGGVSHYLETYLDADQKASWRVHFEQTDRQQYLVTLEPSPDSSDRMTVFGDEWRIDVRYFRKPPSHYRLQWLRTRYTDLNQLPSRPPTTEPLYREASLQSWLGEFMRSIGDRISTSIVWEADAGYWPMTDGAIYELTYEGERLVVTPINDAAWQAVRDRSV
ncbi:MAG: hypothetical protein SVU69_04745 [Pseudomonadota bacterium]|nr:hypothetical protein [Pseudomonadota bacterium]